MTGLRHPHLWLALALIVVVIVAVVLWLHGSSPEGNSASPLSTPAPSWESPLPTPLAENTTTESSPSWVGTGSSLLWVVLGILLALAVALLLLRRYR